MERQGHDKLCWSDVINIDCLKYAKHPSHFNLAEALLVHSSLKPTKTIKIYLWGHIWAPKSGIWAPKSRIWHPNHAFGRPNHDFYMNGAHMRAKNTPLPQFCTEFRSGSNGHGPGPQNPEKNVKKKKITL